MYVHVRGWMYVCVCRFQGDVSQLAILSESSLTPPHSNSIGPDWPGSEIVEVGQPNYNRLYLYSFIFPTTNNPVRQEVRTNSSPCQIWSSFIYIHAYIRIHILPSRASSLLKGNTRLLTSAVWGFFIFEFFYLVETSKFDGSRAYGLQKLDYQSDPIFANLSYVTVCVVQNLS